MANEQAALELFKRALDYVLSSTALKSELEWQRNADAHTFTETELLREAAWVILCSGFREATIRRIFDYISLCFCDWESAKEIVESAPLCKRGAAAAFNNHTKLDAIIDVAKTVQSIGFLQFKTAVLASPITALTNLRFIGPVTSWHLAKNLGIDVVKPDRHLMRVAATLGFENVQRVGSTISSAVGEPLKVVDLVLWRYLADNPHAELISQS
jgi:hypothetical protein